MHILKKEKKILPLLNQELHSWGLKTTSLKTKEI